jgi:hypothetical protein
LRPNHPFFARCYWSDSSAAMEKETPPPLPAVVSERCGYKLGDNQVPQCVRCANGAKCLTAWAEYSAALAVWEEKGRSAGSKQPKEPRVGKSWRLGAALTTHRTGWLPCGHFVCAIPATGSPVSCIQDHCQRCSSCTAVKRSLQDVLLAANETGKLQNLAGWSHHFGEAVNEAMKTQVAQVTLMMNALAVQGVAVPCPGCCSPGECNTLDAPGRQCCGLLGDLVLRMDSLICVAGHVGGPGTQGRGCRRG